MEGIEFIIVGCLTPENVEQNCVLKLSGGSQWGDGFYGYRLKFWPISG